MRLACFDDFRLGVVIGDELVDVSPLVMDQQVGAIIAEWERFGPLLAKGAESGPRQPLDSARIRQPVPRPVNIDCMAMNYIEDGSGVPPAPINAFHKSPSSLIGDGDTMVLPDVPGTVFEGEAELAVIIGKRGYQIPAAEAFEYVFGYTNLIDGSVRGLGPGRNTFYQMKSRDTFCCVGPYIVTADEVPDPQQLEIKLWNNGELMQDFNTRDMAYDIARCIEFVSSLHTVEPGDLIATGTNHQGLHPLMDGDAVELEVEGLGRLHMNVRDDLKRTWERVTREQRERAGLDPIAPQLTGRYADGSAGGGEPDAR